jgi:hypothetical protein
VIDRRLMFAPRDISPNGGARSRGFILRKRNSESKAGTVAIVALCRRETGHSETWLHDFDSPTRVRNAEWKI